MTLRTSGGHLTAESVDDLEQWMRDLRGCPEVNRTVVKKCTEPAHGDEPGTWFYVEAGRADGVARLRCLSCGHAHSVLDSAEHWSYPPTWSCPTCGQSIAEASFGLHVENGDEVTWAALGVRCVNCGDLSGVADFVLAQRPVDEVVASL